MGSGFVLAWARVAARTEAAALRLVSVARAAMRVVGSAYPAIWVQASRATWRAEAARVGSRLRSISMRALSCSRTVGCFASRASRVGARQKRWQSPQAVKAGSAKAKARSSGSGACSGQSWGLSCARFSGVVMKGIVVDGGEGCKG